jgi:hypothetical protein
MKNDFKNDLAFSHSCEDLPCWEEIYRAAFPTMSAMVSHRQDGQHQRAGIDRTVVLSNGKSITVDEKARREDYKDIALEYIANDRTNSPGWVEKHLLCDYIAYAVLPAGKAYLLPVIQLQSAWASSKAEWLRLSEIKGSGFRLCRARNTHYCTISLSVPIPVLFRAIGGALRVEFSLFSPTHEGAGSADQDEEMVLNW